MEEDKDVIAAKEHYKKLKERLKDTKIDYAKLEDDMLEMLGEPLMDRKENLWMRISRRLKGLSNRVD